MRERATYSIERSDWLRALLRFGTPARRQRFQDAEDWPMQSAQKCQLKLASDLIAWQTLDVSLAPVVVIEHPDVLPAGYSCYASAMMLATPEGVAILLRRLCDAGLFPDEVSAALLPYARRVMGESTDFQ
jgi:hypothetical protein